MQGVGVGLKLNTMVAKKTAVLYHYPCPDGVFAALAAHLYLSATSPEPTLFFPNTVYSPLKPNNLPLHDISLVYLLDFSGPPGFLSQLSSLVPKIVVLDHHKTALEMVESDDSIGDNVEKVIDMKRSGATIAFDYFRAKLVDVNDGVGEFREVIRTYDQSRRLFEYIEDADLWKWSLPDSKAFSSGLKDLNIEFDFTLNPSLFDQLLSLNPDSVISLGLVSLSEKQKLIDEVLDQSFEIGLGGGVFGRCLAVTADSISHLRSELGHQLANKSSGLNLRAIGAVVYKVPELENDQLLKISLRSVEKEDTTPISQEFGGGGHRNASSFMLSSAEFERWKVQSNASTQQ